MKRAAEGIAYAPGKKQLRILDGQFRASEDVGAEVGGGEREGIENRMVTFQELGFMEVENNVFGSFVYPEPSSLVGLEIEGKGRDGIYNHVEGVDELVIIPEKSRILNSVDGSLGMLNEVATRVNFNELVDNNWTVGMTDSVGIDGGRGELTEVGVTSGFGHTGFSKLNMLVDTVEDWDPWSFDLNMAFLDTDIGENSMYCKTFPQCEYVSIGERRAEIIDISSDEGKDYGAKVPGTRDAGGSDLEIVEPFVDKRTQVIDLTETTETAIGARNYTREEKGKEKVDDSWLTLATNPTQLSPMPQRQNLVDSAISAGIPGYEARHWMDEGLDHKMEQALMDSRRLSKIRQRENLSRQAQRLARFNHWNYVHESIKPEKNILLSKETNDNLKDLGSPFFNALKMLGERTKKCRAEQLIEWKPSKDHDHNISMPLLPSLLVLSLKLLARNADAIVSLEHIPDTLKQRLTNFLCDSRRMNSHALDLLVRGSPSEIRVKDCSWITREQFIKTFGSFDGKNLKVLQLDLCAQCMLDDILAKTLARTSNSLRSLGIISVRGACGLSDIGLQALVQAAPALCSVNLGQCSLLTCAGIDILAKSLRSVLRELYIGDCQSVDAMLIIPALKIFEHLEVLSVAGIQTVSDEFISDMIAACGQNIKELDLADCLELTDISLKIIGNSCSKLCSLNISNLHKLTDQGMQYLADGCRLIDTLKLCRGRFSDEAIAAFLEVSGQSLKELSLNSVIKIGPNTALSLAKCSRKLLSLDLSWCRRLTNESLGLIVDSCLSLKLLKLFGCSQITSVFLNGHSNTLVRIIGLNLTPVWEHLSLLEPEEVLLRYSPLPLSADSQTMGQ